MKKKIICLLITLAVAASVCCTLSLSADAADWETSGELEFSLNSDGSSYTVAAATKSITKANIPSTFKGKLVTSIGNSAFDGCSGLTSVTIPNSVTSICYRAFRYCSGLTSITIPNSVTSIGYEAFSGCSGLTSVSIPNGVTSVGRYAFSGTGYSNNTSNWTNDVLYIGNYLIMAKNTASGNYSIKDGTKCIADSAFEGCSGLTSVEIPNSVTSIGRYAFYCTGLTSVSIPNGVTSVGRYAFSGTGYSNNTSNWTNDVLYIGNYLIMAKNTASGNYSIKDGTKCIADSAFEGCSGLTSVTIPNSVTSIGGYAFSGCSGLTSVTIGNSVTSIGNSAFSGCSGLTSVTIGNSVTSIGSSAFYKCTGLTSVTIGNSVTSIGGYAFDGCSGLTSVTIPNSVKSIGGYAFDGCSGLTSVTIGNSVTSIGNSAFWKCSGLTSVEIPNSVTSIGSSAFSYCSGLTSVTIGNSVTSIGEDAFKGCSGLTSVTIGNSVTSIGGWAFDGCSGLKSVYITDVAKWCGIKFNNYFANPLYYAHNLYLNGKLVTDLVIPDGVTSVGDDAFYGCSGLTSVTIGNSVTSIGNWAFYNCSGLTSVTIGNSVTSIGKYAFYYCSGLTSVTIPNSVTSIGLYAFEGCSGLTSVTIGNSVTSINGSAFSGCTELIELSVEKGNTVYHSSGNCIIETATKTLVAGCKTSVIPADGSVTSIGWYAFEGCSGLTSVKIPNSVTSIGKSAFSRCSGLAELSVDGGNTVYHSSGNCIIETATKTLVAGCKTSVIPADGSVTSIGDRAFYECSGLTSVKIPNSVTSIGEDAFYKCSELTSVTIPDSVTSIGESAFYGCSGLTSVYITDMAKWCGIRFGSYVGSYSANPLYYAHNLYLNGELVTDLVIPDGVTSIGDWAFEGCSGLTSVSIPNNVTSIGEGAFYHCSGLTSVSVPSINAFYNDKFSSVFSGYSNLKVKINDGVTKIGESAFFNCSGLTSVEIPNSVTSIGKYAFYYCSGLTSVSVPSSDSFCPNGGSSYKGRFSSVFWGCSNLKVKINDGVTSIGAGAFWECIGLTSVEIPNSVTSIGYSAFAYCNNLETIYFNGTEAKWKTISKGSSWDTNAGKDTAKGKYTLVLNSTDPIIVDSGECGDNLTWKLTDDGTITISDTGAMRDYKRGNAPWYEKRESILKIEIENGVTSIGESAFWGCTGLTSISIPDSVTSIGDSAFENCNNLETIYFNGSEAKWNSISKGSDWDYNAGKGTASKYTLVFLYTGYTVSGTATSFGSQTDNVTIQLIKSGTSEAAYEAVVQGNKSNYSIENVESGTYTLRVSKKNHVTREYTVTIGDDNFTQDVIIYLAGDVNGDGKINGTDYLRIRGAFLKTYTLSDEFLKVADVNGDGRINGTDYLRVRGHYLGTYNLYK